MSIIINDTTNCGDVAKLEFKTKDIVASNVEKLKELFPNIVSKNKIDFEKLKQELSDEILDNTKEKYDLTWPGKKEAIITANIPITKTLRPIREKSVDFDNTKNIYIEGDNLEALKILQESYLNKIKCIYIDPPYNTGHDFIYKDNFKKDLKEELLQSGQIDEEGYKLVSNSTSNGKFHSDWLSMIYPRLKLARNLLKDDGIIFISINDIEQANLKKICDEIFGEKNFIAQIVWTNKEGGGGSDTKLIKVKHEYILCYSKLIDNVDIYGNIAERTNRPFAVIDKYSSTQASKQLQKLLNGKFFDYSKPTELIKYLLKISTKSNDLVLDFFSGSATTAQAVMTLNAEDNGNRKYIMVQIPEKCPGKSKAFKLGYNTICEIGEERVRRAGIKIKEETNAEVDYGFQVYRIENSNIE